MLHELWITDKHRHVNLNQFFVGLHDVKSEWPFPDFPQSPGDPSVEFEITTKAPPGPFRDGALLGTVVQSGRLTVNLPQMHLNPATIYDVAFEQGPPAYGGMVATTLATQATVVRGIIDRFAHLS